MRGGRIDSALLVGAWRTWPGDEALAAVQAAVGPIARTACARVGLPRGELDDIAQQVVMRAAGLGASGLRCAPSSVPVMAWLRETASRVAHEHVRFVRRGCARAEAPAYLRSMQRRRVERRGRLGPWIAQHAGEWTGAQATLMRLYFDGLSYDALAQRLGCSLAQVKDRVRRIRRRLLRPRPPPSPCAALLPDLDDPRVTDARRPVRRELELRASGLSHGAIAAALGRSRDTVRRSLRRARIATGPPPSTESPRRRHRSPGETDDASS